MRKIVSLEPTQDFQLFVKFDNGVKKKVDIKPYLQFPVFSVLKNLDVFQSVINKVYFIEWKDQELDLSADTLWHDGKIS